MKNLLSAFQGMVVLLACLSTTVSAEDFILNVAKANAPFTVISEAIAAIPVGTTDSYVVRVAPGTYTYDCSIEIPSNVSLKGSGASSTILYCPGLTNSVFNILNAEHVDISGFTIKGDRVLGIYINNSAHITINNNTFTGTTVYQRGIKIEQSPNHINIMNNKFYGLKVAVEAIASRPWINNNTFNTKGDILGQGIITWGGSSAIIDNNVFDGLESAISVSGYADNGTGSEPSNPTIKNNVIKNSLVFGIESRYLPSLTVKNNLIKDNNIGVYSYASSNVVYDGNTIVGNTTNDLELRLTQSLFSFNHFDTFYNDGWPQKSSYNTNSAGEVIDI